MSTKREKKVEVCRTLSRFLGAGGAEWSGAWRKTVEAAEQDVTQDSTGDRPGTI